MSKSNKLLSFLLFLFIAVLVFAKVEYVHGNPCGNPCDPAFDIVLVLDESGSISASEFSTLKNFTIDFLKLFSISPTKTHVGIVMFGTKGRNLLALSDNPTTVLNALNTVTKLNGETNTYEGLLLARNQLAHSRRVSKIPQIILVITDGNANEPGSDANARALAIQQANIFKSDPLHILIGVGVGNFINIDFIKSISSPNATFHVSNFAALKSNINAIRDAACYRPPRLHFPAKVFLKCTDLTHPNAVGYPFATGWCHGCPPNKPTYTDVVIPGKCPQEKTIVRTWTVTDKCWGRYTAKQTIIVRDTTAPTISPPKGKASVTLECPADTSTVKLGGATAFDNCDRHPVITHTDKRKDGICPNEYTLFRTFTATDHCGNSKSTVQTVQVVDSTPPTVTKVKNFCLFPPNHKFYCISNLKSSGIVEAKDSCSNNTYILFKKCTSNQLKEDDAIPDCHYDKIKDKLCFRAQRSGTISSPRVYTVELQVADYLTSHCWNLSPPVILKVTVPHDQKNPAFKHCLTATQLAP